MTGGLGPPVLVALLALIPLVALMLTSFVKISVVLSLLRNALGSPDAPSGLIVTGLSLVLTAFVMAPVAIDMAQAASQGSPASTPAGAAGGAGAARSGAPGGGAANVGAAEASAPGGGTASVGAAGAGATGGAGVGAAGAPDRADVGVTVEVEGAIRALAPPQVRGDIDAVARALVPLRGFLARHAAARDRETFVALAARTGRAVHGDEIWVLAPAFLSTELREAFAMAVLLFVPFLVIDLVVGLGLAALGLASTSPQTVALPLKLLLFVSVDGWRLLLDALVRGYA